MQAHYQSHTDRYHADNTGHLADSCRYTPEGAISSPVAWDGVGVQRRRSCVINSLQALLPGRRSLTPLGDPRVGTVFAFLIAQQDCHRRRHGRHHTHEKGRQAMKVKTGVKAGFVLVPVQDVTYPE